MEGFSFIEKILDRAGYPYGLTEALLSANGLKSVSKQAQYAFKGQSRKQDKFVDAV